MAISDRKKREKKQRKESIIDAAEMLFFTNGYDEVSINDIALEVELNRATIYLYFENKEALCFSVILRGMRILKDMVKKYVDKRSDPIHKINAIGSSYYMFFQRYPQYFKVYYNFQSGRFDLKHPWYDSSKYNNVRWDIEEILKIQRDIFEILHSSVKNYIKNNDSLDLDSLFTTIFIFSTLDGMINPSPVIESELEDMKLNEYQNFNVIFLKFINKFLNNK